MLHKRGHHNEKPAHHNEEQPPLAATRRKPACSNEDPTQPKINKFFLKRAGLPRTSQLEFKICVVLLCWAWAAFRKGMVRAGFLKEWEEAAWPVRRSSALRAGM